MFLIDWWRLRGTGLFIAFASLYNADLHENFKTRCGAAYNVWMNYITWIIIDTMWANIYSYDDMSYHIAKTSSFHPSLPHLTTLDSNSLENCSECCLEGDGEAGGAFRINKVCWFDIRCDILEERGHPPPQDQLLKHFYNLIFGPLLSFSFPVRMFFLSLFLTCFSQSFSIHQSLCSCGVLVMSAGECWYCQWNSEHLGPNAPRIFKCFQSRPESLRLFFSLYVPFACFASFLCLKPPHRSTQRL